jgi:hypothetical protein
MRAQERARLVPKEQFNELYRRLRLWRGTGYIEADTYVIGMHVLAKMAQMDSLVIAASWQEFCDEVITQGSEVLATCSTDSRYYYLGAIQQLQELVGIFSHYNMDGLEEDKKEALEGDGTCSHFTSRPGPESDIMKGATPLIFAWFDWAGEDPDAHWEGLQKHGRKVVMPSWVRIEKRGKG